MPAALQTGNRESRILDPEMNRLNSDGFKAQDAKPDRADDEIDLSKLFALIRRNWHIFVLGGLVGLLLAVAQVATTTRLYTAHVEINTFRSADVETFQDFTGVAGSRNMSFDFDTEIEVLRSEKIAERVARNLRLHEDAGFNAPRSAGVLSRISGAVTGQLMGLVRSVRAGFSTGGPAPPSPESLHDAEQRAIENAARRLRGGMSVTPVRNSWVLRISYTSPSRNVAARVANGIAEAYIEDQLASTDEASQRAIEWLQTRRDELRVQLEQIMDIVDRFREENNLLGVDVNQLADAELERLSQNLITARAELVELEARDRRLTEIVMNEDTSAVVRETATQGITSGLRARYLDVLSSYNTLAASLGDDHAQTQRRFRELEEIETLMFEEIRRSAQLVRDDLRAARERVRSLEAAQARVGERVGADQATIMQLRDLERDIETVRNLHASFQQRHQEATQRQQIPVSNARILNRAQPPGGPSYPNTQRMLALGGLLGFLVAGGFVAFREWRDDRVRSEEHVREDLGLEYLGSLSVIKGLAHTLRGVSNPAGERAKVVPFPEMLTFAADKPLSSYAETLRTGKISLTLRHGQTTRAPKVGFVSCFPGEGKTTTAANFASLMAQQGAKVILIDGDIRNPGLSRATGKTFDTGLVDVLLGEAKWQDVCNLIEGTEVHLLPNTKTRVAHTSELLGSKGMIALLEELDQVYDYVIVDLPPLGPVVDARAILDKLDGLFFVLKWGGTNRDIARRILRMDPRVRDKCVGAFMNFFDPKKARAYGNYHNYRYYRSYYNRYYHDN